MLDLQIELLRRCHSGGMVGKLEGYLRGSMEDLLPHDAHDRCTGRVGIVVTSVWPRVGKVNVTAFADRTHLIETLVGSCYVPLWLGGRPVLPYTYHSRTGFVVDGGLLRPIPWTPLAEGAIEVHPFTVYPNVAERGRRHDAISPMLLGKDFDVKLPRLLSWVLGFNLREENLRYMYEAGVRAAAKWDPPRGGPPR